MFLPDHFRVEDVAEMHALMRARPFAALVSTTQAGLYGTHLPTVLKEEGAFGTIECHLSRANPHWKDLAEGGEAMMIFQGPDGYITPNWYRDQSRDRKGRPDLELRDRARLRAAGGHEEKDWLLRHVTELSDQQERSEAHPWKVSDAPEKYIDVMTRGIVGFRFEITRLEGKWKMSQNREPQDRVRVIEGLKARATGDDLAIAETVAAKMTAGG